MAPTPENNPRRGRSLVVLILWLVLLVVFLQGALASFQEFEPRAGIILLAIFFLLLFGGLIASLVQRNRLL